MFLPNPDELEPKQATQKAGSILPNSVSTLQESGFKSCEAARKRARRARHSLGSCFLEHAQQERIL